MTIKLGVNIVLNQLIVSINWSSKLSESNSKLIFSNSEKGKNN